MNFDRLLGCVHLRRNLFVQQAHNDETQNFKLTRRQFIDTSTRLASLLAFAQVFLATPQSALDCFDEFLVVKRLRQKSTASSFIARVAVGTSPWPVRKTIFSQAPRDSSASCNPGPFNPGMRTSRTREIEPSKISRV